MNLEIIKQQASSMLETLQEQFEIIKSTEGKIPQIELDIMLQNTRNLYEALLSLNKVNNMDSDASMKVLQSNVEKITEAESPVNSIEQTPAATESGNNAEEKTSVYDQKENADNVNKEESTETVDKKLTEERTRIISKPLKSASSGNLFEETALVGNKYEGRQTVHDKISKSKEDKTWNEKLQNQPLQDLKKSIGINEKFKFVNDLFDGSLQDYNESIDFLNNCKTFTETENYIEQTLKPKFNWKKESGVYQSLLFLIQRKFNY